MGEKEKTTRFVYDVSWILLAYLNTCVLALTAAAEGEPGACITVSFQ